MGYDKVFLEADIVQKAREFYWLIFGRDGEKSIWLPNLGYLEALYCETQKPGRVFTIRKRK